MERRNTLASILWPPLNMAAILGIVVGAFMVPQRSAAAQAGPTFEVSMVSSDAIRLGSRGSRMAISRTPQRLAFQNALLADVMAFAYGMPVDRIERRPQWMYEDLFDITVTTADPASVEEQKLTLQKLIGERFSLVFHRATNPSPVYFLVAGANVKLTKSSADETDGLAQFVPRGAFAPRGATAAGASGPPGITVEGWHASMGDLALWLYSTVQLPVVDKTGITGYFDVQIPGVPVRPNLEGVTLAVQNALGLNLEMQDGTAESLVIDHVEPPKVN